MFQVFVSYSRRDTTFVLRLVRDLKQQGIKVWLDQLDILPGTPWDLSVEAALGASSHILFVVSQSSVISKNVLDEIGYALGENKRVVPVIIDNAPLPLRVSRLQYADFRVSYTDAFDRLRSMFLSEGLRKDIENETSIAEKEMILTPSVQGTSQNVEGQGAKPVPSSAEEKFPEIPGYRIIKLVSNTGLSTVYLAERVGDIHTFFPKLQTNMFLLKLRPKDITASIDYSRIKLSSDKFAMPTDIHEYQGLICEALPYQEGWSLSEIVQLNGGGIYGELLDSWTVELLQLLDILHKHIPAIIHRDLKPENILVRPKTLSLMLLDLTEHSEQRRIMKGWQNDSFT